jgi:hypothetical protein
MTVRTLALFVIDSWSNQARPLLMLIFSSTWVA